MDRLTIIGIVVALAAIFGGQMIEGGSAMALINPSAFVIVFGGTVGAVMLQTHGKTFAKALSILGWIFKTPSFPLKETIVKITSWSHLARREGLLGLEKSINPKMDPYTLKGLNMLVDGNDAEAIRNALYIELDVATKELMSASRVFESLGGYAPTIGIVGAVLGLIQVMGNLTNPEVLGQGIATAFVATIYGVGFANLFFLPIYHKLRAVISQKAHYMEMVLEGIACIAEGENPRVIQLKLEGFVERK
ncbi:MAG: chemotaxis protein MotA [Polaribacter sp.]|jgi:chemotaxis protein MotA